MAIGQATFDLSMINQDTGRYMTANVYTVDGVKDADGSLRQLSIGQLVMAICLQRASEMETSIITLMEKLNETSAQLADLTKIEQAVVDEFAANTSAHSYNLNNVSVSTATNAVTLLRELGIINANQTAVSTKATLANSEIRDTDFITAIEAKMDEKNSFSQQNMIELQSLTNKRDQSYDLVSAMLKSLNTTISGNLNNM